MNINGINAIPCNFVGVVFSNFLLLINIFFFKDFSYKRFKRYKRFIRKI